MPTNGPSRSLTAILDMNKVDPRDREALIDPERLNSAGAGDSLATFGYPTMKEGLFTVRLMMTIASLTPLFVLAGIRGFGTLVSDRTAWMVVGALIAIPNAILALRINRARSQKDQAHFEVESATDNREHLLVYLFAVLMPLYQSTFSTHREVIANLFVFVFVIYLFMHMHLHYMNIIFAVFGYRVFTVVSGGNRVMLLSKRTQLAKGDTLAPYRLSNTVYFEA